jgi:hypothetical protein
MRLVIVIVSMLALTAAGGCTAGFTGEWLEEGVSGPDGRQISPTGDRRVALSFDPVSGVRYGRYNERVGVVDNVSSASGEYFVFDGWNKAQFGSLIARVDGDRMSAAITGGQERIFHRVHGPSIFPPLVELPSFTEK